MTGLRASEAIATAALSMIRLPIMSMTSALLSYGLWHTVTRVAGGRQFNILENNINQTAASSGASIAGAGLVAAVPALTMLTAYPARRLRISL